MPSLWVGNMKQLSQWYHEPIRFSIYHWKNIFKMLPNLKPNCCGCTTRCRKFYFSFVGHHKPKKFGNQWVKLLDTHLMLSDLLNLLLTLLSWESQVNLHIWCCFGIFCHSKVLHGQNCYCNFSVMLDELRDLFNTQPITIPVLQNTSTSGLSHWAMDIIFCVNQWQPSHVCFREVEKAVSSCREMQHQWRNMLNETSLSKRDDYDRVSNELRNSLRSIEWDLEDLDETIDILLLLCVVFFVDPSLLSYF